MNVIFRLIGELAREKLFECDRRRKATHVDVNDKLNILDIQTTCSDVGGNENHLFTASKFTDGKITL